MNQPINSYLVVSRNQVVFSSSTLLESIAFVKGRGEGVICSVLSEVVSVSQNDRPTTRATNRKKPKK